MKDTSEAIEILENAIIIYNDGMREKFDAMHITDKGVIIGRILKKDETDETFLGFGYISKHSIKHIRQCSKRKIHKMEL